MMAASPYKRCIMILADGSRPDVFEKLLHEGRLPCIDRYLVQRGSFHHAVSVFPSTTGPAYLPFLTGCYPGTCNVPGIRWFDKDVYATKRWSRLKHRSYVGADTLKMNHDINPKIQTLFDLVPKSVNIFSGVSRGVPFSGNKTKFLRIWNWYYAHLTDRWSMVDENATRKVVSSLEENPEFVFVVFPGIDEYSHMGDPWHSATMAAYERLDAAVGVLGRKLEQKRWLDETVMMIVSDHGLSQTHKHLGVNQLLESAGTKTFYYPVIFKWGFSAAHMVSGNGMSHLYLPRGANGQAPARRQWEGVCYQEDFTSSQEKILDLLAEQAAVALIAVRCRDGGVWVRSGAQRARIYQAGDKIRYEKIQGDPLGYGERDSLTPEQWLRETIETDYPDAPVQLLQLIRSPRCGDVMLSARRGYDLRLRYEVPEHHGSHGSLHKEHMLIPIISSAPLSSSTLRSVDVFPTVCEWLGRTIPPNIDGISRA